MQATVVVTLAALAALLVSEARGLRAGVWLAKPLASTGFVWTALAAGALEGGLYGQTVLARAAQLAGIDFDNREAHSASYDAERTADLFCQLCNDLHESFLRAEEKARALGWKDGAPAPLDLVEGD